MITWELLWKLNICIISFSPSYVKLVLSEQVSIEWNFEALHILNHILNTAYSTDFKALCATRTKKQVI